MIITFKQKLTAIKGSIDNWDSIAAGKEGAKRSCPLCVLYGMCSRGCPIYMKTGEEHCRGTPYRDYIKAKENQQEYPNNPDYISTAACAAKDFRDWLKDLYIEVSEAGDKVEKTTKVRIDSTVEGISIGTLVQIIKDLEKESISNRAYTLGRIVGFVESKHKLEEQVKKLEGKAYNNETDIVKLFKDIRNLKCK